MISGLLVMFTLLFLTRFFYHLPLTILSSIVIVAAVGIVDFRTLISLYQTSAWSDLTVFVVAFLATLSAGIEIGLCISVAISLLMVLFFVSRPAIVLQSRQGMLRQESTLMNESELLDDGQHCCIHNNCCAGSALYQVYLASNSSQCSAAKG